MKPSTSKSDGKKRKKDESNFEPESPKRSKVHAQRKFAQGAGVVSPAISPNKERDRPKSTPRIVTPPAEPLQQSRVPTTVDFLTFVCFQHSNILPPSFDNLFNETSVTSTSPAAGPSNTRQQTPKQQSKKLDKAVNEGKKQPVGVQALRKKYKEQRIAKQKPSDVTKLAKKVKGKNMVRTRSTAVVEEVKKVRKVAPADNRKTKATVQSDIKRPPGRPPNVKTNLSKIVKKKKQLTRAGLRSGGSVKEPKALPKTATPVKLKKQEEQSKTTELNRKPAVVSTPLKSLRPKKSPVEREIGSDFSSDDNEPLLAHSVPDRPQTRGGGVLQKLKVNTAEVRPTRRTKTAATAYMEVLSKKLVSPKGNDEPSFEDFPEPPYSRRHEKRENVTPSKRLATEIKPSPKAGQIKKAVVKATELEKPKKKLKKDGLRPSTRSQVPNAAVIVKKPAMRSLIQKKKLMSLRTLTRLKNSKLRRGIGSPEAKNSNELSEKQKNEPISLEQKKQKESELSTRKLRVKSTEATPSSKNTPAASSSKKTTAPIKENKSKIAEKLNRKTKEKAETGLGGVAKRPVRKCSTIDKMWIDIDGLTSDEDDFVDVDSMTDIKQNKADEMQVKNKNKDPVNAPEKEADNISSGAATRNSAGKTAAKKLTKRQPIADENEEKNICPSTTNKKVTCDTGRKEGELVAPQDRISCDSTRKSTVKSVPKNEVMQNDEVLKKTEKLTSSKNAQEHLSQVRVSKICINEAEATAAGKPPVAVSPTNQSSIQLPKDQVTSSKEDKETRLVKNVKQIGNSVATGDNVKTTRSFSAKESEVPSTVAKNDSGVTKQSKSVPAIASGKSSESNQSPSTSNPSNAKKPLLPTLAVPPQLEPTLPKTAKAIMVPTSKAPSAASPEVKVSEEKSVTTSISIFPNPVPPPVTADRLSLPVPTTFSTGPSKASPTKTTYSNIPIRTQNKITTPEGSIPSSPTKGTGVRDSHALIARLAASVSMTSQPAAAKAITKDLKCVQTSLHSEHVKEETDFLKNEPSIKSEDSKILVSYEEKKDFTPTCLRPSTFPDMKPFSKDSALNKSFPHLPIQDSLLLKLEPKKVPGMYPIKKSDFVKSVQEQQSIDKDVALLSGNNHVKSVANSSGTSDSTNSLIITNTQDTEKSKSDRSEFKNVELQGDSSCGKTPLNPATPVKEIGHRQTSQRVDDKLFNKESKQGKKPADSGNKKLPSKRRRASRSTQSSSFDAEKRERPKRQCSSFGKSWIERDSDDSSFYQSDGEDFLELIRQSELAERKQKERAQRRSWKSSSKDEKEFSDSDDEPLKKKSTSSASVMSSLTQEAASLSQPADDSVSIPKNSPGKSETPQECDNRAGVSDLEGPPAPAVTFIPPPMREPINTHGLDLLSEVVTYGNFGAGKSTARIEQWLNENLRADTGKAFLGFDESEIQRPVENVSNPDPAVQIIMSPSQQTVQDSCERQNQKVPPKNSESTFKRKPVASVQDLLKLQKERREAPKPPPEQHSKNCQCNSCVVKKGWFKNKPMPDNFKLSSREASPSKPFQFLTSAFSGPSSEKTSPEMNSVKVSASIAPMVLNKDIKTVGTQRKSFLERMRERERKEAMIKPNACAFSPNNESSVYAFEPEPERPSQPKVTPFRSRSTSSRSKEDSEEDKSRHQSTSIAVQTNFEDVETQTLEIVPNVTDDGKSNEISTQTDGADDDPDSAMFYIPLEESGSSQPLIQGVTLKLDAEGPLGPTRRVVMKAKLVTKAATSTNLKAVVTPLQKVLNPKNTPVGTVQPTARKPAASAATASSPTQPRAAEKLATSPVESDEVPLSSLRTKRDRQSSPDAKHNVSPPSPKPSTSGNSTVSAAEASSKHSVSSKEMSPVATASKSTASGNAKVVEAPTFHLTEKEFQDPLEFFERIRPTAERFGLCRIVPPSSFKPDCKVADDMRFTAYNQFVHRMLHRWGPSVRETMAMKKYLKTQRISLKPPPCVGGMEIDLPRLYKAVQTCGGLMKVMEKQKWQHIADMMRIPKAAHDLATKLDSIYCQYLLPYDTLTPDERDKLLQEVGVDWAAYEKTIGEAVAEEDDEEEEENYIEECEECIVKGRNMALSQFYRIARNTMSMWFKAPEPSPSEVEEEFWRHVTERTNHVCVHSGSIDSSGWGYGFPVGKNNFAKHPWNLKVLTNNHGSVLRSLGPVMGVTVPTLHVGMVFAAFCWYRDPHGLPWIEYLHTGAPKIWYGISDDNSEHLREALTQLLPRHIRNQRSWLPCDTAMAPPEKLAELGVPLSRTTQEPGQFVLVFPRAFTSSLCTGYLVSESVYFALPSWLQTAEQVFDDIHESAESSAFSLDNLLFRIAGDSRASLHVLQLVLPMVQRVHDRELKHRKDLETLGVKSEMLPRETSRKKSKNSDPESDHECEICRASLFLSLVSIAAEESVYCLKHGLQQLTDNPDLLSGAKLLYLFDQDEIDQVQKKLEDNISAKLQKSSKK